jgi:preprotein translocase subunit SecA
MLEKADAAALEFADEKLLPEDWDWKALNEAVFKQFNFRLGQPDEDAQDGLTADGLGQMIYEAAQKTYTAKENLIGSQELRQLERIIMLQTLDNLWKDHLLSMDHLKEGIGLRGYAQQNPLIVYKKEGFEMFQGMIERIKEETLGILFRIQLAESEEIDDLKQPKQQEMFFSGGEAPASKKKPARRTKKKVGRNAPCPCGSGKKYKKCCGK